MHWNSCPFFHLIGVQWFRGCSHDTGATFAPERVHSGSLSWLYICLHDTTTNFMLARVTPAWVHPGSCTGARISLRYEISQRYHVNTKRAPVSVWNRSVRRLERVAHGKCLWLWNTRASDYFESFLLPQLLRGENDSTQSDEIQATIAGLLRWTFSYGL